MRGVYAGSFDPLTNGHLCVIEQGSQLFDTLVVAIGINPDKKRMFSVEDSLAMIRDSTAHLKGGIVCDFFENKFLVDYASRIFATHILRGIRNVSDYESERTWCNLNRDLDSNITTVFLMPPREIAEVSSSAIKGMVGLEGWEDRVKKYVPLAVFEKLKEAHRGRKS